MATIIPSGSGGKKESVAELQSRINAACSLFVEMGFQPALFTISMIRSNGLTENEFLELIEPISSITNLDDLRSVFDAAARQLVHASFSSEFSKFLTYVSWLKYVDGKKVVDDVLKKKNPEEKNNKLSKAQIEFAQMLVDYGAPRKLEQMRIQGEIEELKKQQMELEAESLSIYDDTLEKLGPLLQYKQIPIRSLRVRAYKLYKKDCTYNGINAIPGDAGYAKAVKDFGEVVKENHLLKFLSNPVRKEFIKNFFKMRVVNLNEARDGYNKFVVAGPSNETVNTVRKFALDMLEEEIYEKQPRDEEEHGGD
ncbi:uncharacterized protein LOC131613035 [Vicia villosa]|uniref:uncharacterized protein LOC131613035 n=1 Tax=Vicia villosa TaxID=3911 RepID=UPI00273C5308|nr:uncharacterized protein LOC131613035 [Vicia villosa]